LAISRATVTALVATGARTRRKIARAASVTVVVAATETRPATRRTTPTVAEALTLIVTSLTVSV
jgi:hypothetical protein